MDQPTLSELLNEIHSLKADLTNIVNEVNENEKLLLELLKKNNNDTEKIHRAIIEDKSMEQQTKDFLLNVAANLAGNAIRTPVIIDISGNNQKY